MLPFPDKIESIATIGMSAQATPPIAPIQSGYPSFGEYGIWGALLIFSAREAWRIFGQKEQSESDLVSKLITGLQTNQAQMLSQMLAVTERSHIDMKELKEAILQLSTMTRSDIQQVFRVQDRRLAELRQTIIQLQQELKDRSK